ncbi:hypothetical protein ACWDOP_06150 [Nocardia sp. NPDC003693]
MANSQVWAGDSVHWIAVRGKSPDAVCAELGLRRTGVYECDSRTQYAGAVMADGWFLIVEDGRNEVLRNRTDFARLSQDCEVIECTLEAEYLDSDSAIGWRDGWRRSRSPLAAVSSSRVVCGGRVLVDLPEAAGPRRSFAPDATAGGEIDSHGFSEFRNPYGRILTHWIANRSELEASEPPPTWIESAG